MIISDHENHDRLDDAGIWHEMLMRFIPTEYAEGRVRIAPWLASRLKPNSAVPDQTEPTPQEHDKSYPTVGALIMARAMKRLAGKYEDLGLARYADLLNTEAVEALRKRHSALSKEALDTLRRAKNKEASLALRNAQMASPQIPIVSDSAGEPKIERDQLTLEPDRTSSENPLGSHPDLLAEKYARLHKEFLEQNNPSVLSGQDDPTSYLSSMGRLAAESWRHQMHQFAKSREVQSLPHLDRIRALQNYQQAVEEQILHDHILQPVPE
jgi:hypothetical protein